MTTTARTATRQIATTTAALFELVILGIDFDDCDMCGHASAELFDRLTEDYDEVRACETCVNTLHLGYVAD